MEVYNEKSDISLSPMLFMMLSVYPSHHLNICLKSASFSCLPGHIFTELIVTPAPPVLAKSRKNLQQ